MWLRIKGFVKQMYGVKKEKKDKGAHPKHHKRHNICCRHLGKRGGGKKRCPRDNRLNIYTARTKTSSLLTSHTQKKNFKKSFSTPNYHLDSLTRREKNVNDRRRKNKRGRKIKGGVLIRKINRGWIFKREGVKKWRKGNDAKICRLSASPLSLGVVEKGELGVHLTEGKKNF